MAEGRARKRFKTNQIVGAFAARPIAMLQSQAYRVLSRAAHMVLARLEVEHAQHGGKENGRLPCTYAHFKEYGVHTNTIAPAIRELVALGFVEITRPGVAGNADCRQPALYRLTYRHVDNAPGDGTHEWRKIATAGDADRVAKEARDNVNPRAVAHGKKTKSQPQKVRSAPTSESEVETGKSPTSESEVTSHATESEVTSITLPALASFDHAPNVVPIRRHRPPATPVADPEPSA